MLDGSTEKTGHGLVGIVARYVDANISKVLEHVIDIKDASDDKSAKGLLQLLESTLEDEGVTRWGCFANI